MTICRVNQLNEHMTVFIHERLNSTVALVDRHSFKELENEVSELKAKIEGLIKNNDLLSLFEQYNDAVSLLKSLELESVYKLGMKDVIMILREN